MLIHSYENESNLHVKEISFSYEKMSTKTRFEEEAKGNSEMAYLRPNRVSTSLFRDSFFNRIVPIWNNVSLDIR